MKIIRAKFDKFTVNRSSVHVHVLRVLPYISIINDDGWHEYPLDDSGNFLRWKIYPLEIQIGFWVFRFMVDIEGENIRLPYHYNEDITSRIKRSKETMERENAKYKYEMGIM